MPISQNAPFGPFSTLYEARVIRSGGILQPQVRLSLDANAAESIECPKLCKRSERFSARNDLLAQP